MDYGKLPNTLINRQIARRLGWRVKRIARLHFITLDPNGQQVHGGQFRNGDFYRQDAWLAAIEKAGRWADDLNAAAQLFLLAGCECDLCYTLIPVAPYGTWVWEAMIDLDHKGDEIPYEGIADNPARAICIAWLYWHDAQQEAE